MLTIAIGLYVLQEATGCETTTTGYSYSDSLYLPAFPSLQLRHCYSDLPASFSFQPIAVQTLGPINESAVDFLRSSSLPICSRSCQSLCSDTMQSFCMTAFHQDGTSSHLLNNVVF